MGITETSIIYAIIGAVVASAMWLATPAEHAIVRGSRFVLHTVLWPFFAPLLLGRSFEAEPSAARAWPARDQGGDPRVNQAEQRLLDALASLDGIAEDVLGSQMEHVRDLTGSLAAMARRVGEMDELLATGEFDQERAQAALEAIGQQEDQQEDGADPDTADMHTADMHAADMQARRDSVRARLRNIRRLKQMRHASSADLERAILKIEEISSQIRLLRFADRPEHEVSGLIQDIAATVEGLSEGLLSTQ
jgi:hypothetical protein